MAYKVLREIRKDLPRFCGREIAVSVNGQVAEMLLGPVRKALQSLSRNLGREIEVRARPGLHREQFEVTALDSGPPVSLSLSWLPPKSDEQAGPDAQRSEAEESPDIALPEEIAALEPSDGGLPAADLPPDPEKPEVEHDGDPEPLLATAAPETVDAEAESPILPRSTPEEP